MQKKILALAISVLVLALFLSLIDFEGIWSMPESMLTLIRLSGLLLLGIYAYHKKSLTVWTFTAMIGGVIIGYDFPQYAKELNVLGKIFLRLIKTIIAPLLFATLLVGIAGHSNLNNWVEWA
jgi:proton glutamate symport protein